MPPAPPPPPQTPTHDTHPVPFGQWERAEYATGLVLLIIRLKIQNESKHGYIVTAGTDVHY